MGIINENKMNAAENIVRSFDKKQAVKVVKRDNGLLERNTREEKIILAEDNRQVLLG